MTGISKALTLAAMSTLWSAEAPATQAPAASIPALPTASVLDRSALERYVGTYKTDIWTAKVAVAKNGQLTLQINGLEPVPLIAEREGQFRPAGVKATTLVFHADAAGISHFILNREGNEIRAVRKRSKARPA